MTTLIGRRCTPSNVFSRPVLIGRWLGTFMPVLAMEVSGGGFPLLTPRFPVAIAAESHPFPSRTRKLSPPAPMVLGGKPPGRVGRRRIILKREEALSGASSLFSGYGSAMPPGRKWGGVARRGAGKVDPDRPPPRDRGGRKPPKTERREPKELGPPPAWEPEQWIEEPD